MRYTAALGTLRSRYTHAMRALESAIQLLLGRYEGDTGAVRTLEDARKALYGCFAGATKALYGCCEGARRRYTIALKTL